MSRIYFDNQKAVLSSIISSSFSIHYMYMLISFCYFSHLVNRFHIAVPQLFECQNVNAADMASGSVTCTPSFIIIGTGIQPILRLLHQKYERLQCWYY
jgi:hypothetical protein